MDENELRHEICHIGRMMWERGFVTGRDGNLSARLPGARVLVTPGGGSKAALDPATLVTVDLDGQVVASPGGGRATSELGLHLEVYRQRPEAAAVVHAHPPVTVALSIAGISLARCLLPEVILALGLIPTAPYATPASAESREAVRDLIARHDGLVLERHGTLTIGRDLTDAYLKLETIEHLAHVTLLAHQAGGAPGLTAEQVERLIVLRDKLGRLRPGDAEALRAACHA